MDRRRRAAQAARRGRRGRRAVARRLHAALRLLCAVVITLFIGQSALAYAAPCIALDDCTESCPNERDDKECPCPLQCASCCAGNALRAIPPSPLSLDPPHAAPVELLFLTSERAPPPSEPAEILHVPKIARA